MEHSIMQEENDFLVVVQRQAKEDGKCRIGMQ